MFGTFRLILAYLVFASHTPHGQFGPFNPGQWAVIGFFVLSGYIMAARWEALRAEPFGERIRHFYLDRVLRILPLYWLVLSLCLVLGWAHGSGPQIIGNLLLLPLTVHPWTPDLAWTQPLWNPVWSLGTEWQFYLAVPLLLGAASRLRGAWLLLAISLSIFFAGSFIAPSGPLVFMNIPGILFPFIAGITLYEQRRDNAVGSTMKLHWAVYALLAALLPAFAFLKWRYPSVPCGLSINAIIGYLITLPVIVCLSRYSPKISRLDRTLGELAYPLFIIHTPILQALNHDTPLWQSSAIVLLASLLVGLLFERPFGKVRHWLLWKASTPATAPFANASAPG